MYNYDVYLMNKLKKYSSKQILEKGSNIFFYLLQKTNSL